MWKNSMRKIEKPEKRERKNSLYFTFLASYLILALIPMLCFSAVYYRDLSQNVTQVVDAKTDSNLQSIITALDSHLSILKNLPYAIEKNSTFRAFRQTEDTLTRKEAIDVLKQLAGSNSLIQNIWVYFRTSGKLVSAYSNSYDRQMILKERRNLRFSFGQMTSAETFSLLDGLTSCVFLPVCGVYLPERKTNVQCVALLQTMPVDSSIAYGNVIVLIDAQALESLLSADSNERYALIDNTGSVVLSRGFSQETLQQQILPRLSQTEQNSFQFSMEEGREETLMVRRSAESGWSVVKLNASQDLQARLVRVQLRLLAVLGIAGMLSTAVMIWFMRRTYRPVSQLVSLADEVVPGEQEHGLRVVENALNYLQIENTRLSTALESNNPVMAEYWARMILSTPESELSQYMLMKAQQSGLKLHMERYQIAILRYEDAYQVKQAMKNLVECCCGLHIGSFVENDRAQILLILGGKQDHKSLFDAIDLTKLDPFNAAVSGEVSRVQEWNAAYLQATQMDDYMRLHQSERCVFRYEELEQSQGIVSQVPWQTLQTFAIAVNQGNTRMVQMTLIPILEYLKNERGTDMPQVVFCKVASCFLGTLQSNRDQITQDMQRAFGQGEAMDVHEMCATLESMADSFCQQENRANDANASSPVYRSLPYIEKHFCEEQLSLATVAEQVGLSASRFSTLFHEQMNCNFKEYVDALRFEKAKRLLKESDLLIAEIARQVGYENSYSFSRLFKRLAGVTPQAYRQSCQDGSRAES